MAPPAQAGTPGAAPPPAVVTPRGKRPRPGGGVANAPPPPPPKLPESATIKEGAAVEAGDGRVIIKEGGHVRVKHDDGDRFRSPDARVDVQRLPGGRTLETVVRPNGWAILTVRDRDGTVLKRSRRSPDGHEVVLIDDTRRPPPPPPGQIRVDLGRSLPPIVVTIPRQDYIVESRGASRQRIQQALIAPPIEAVERPYSLDEIRWNSRIRDKVRRIDIDTVNFNSGQATLTEDQVAKLDVIGRALSAVITQNPAEVYLIEGHTDAVGSDLFNLSLSDQRAQSVAEILSYYYGIPPENLVTQGYGESYLKVPTLAAEVQNRRVTVRRITPLLNAQTQ